MPTDKYCNIIVTPF